MNSWPRGRWTKPCPYWRNCTRNWRKRRSIPLAPAVEYQLAFCYWVNGEEDKAIPLAEHGYRTHGDLFEKGSRGRLLGMCYLTSGRTEEGTHLFEESLKLLEAARPLAALTTRHTLELAALYHDEQRWAEVSALLEKVLTGYQQGDIKGTIDNYDVFRVRWSLALAYWHEKRFDDVKKQLIRFRGYEPLFARHPDWRQTAGQAGAILNYLEKYPQAVEAGDTSLEDIVGVVHDDWRYQGLVYKGPRAEGGWGAASGR